MTRSAVVMHQFNASTLEISSIYSSIPFYITSVALQPICLESTAYNIYFVLLPYFLITFCKRNVVLGPKFWMSHMFTCS